MFVNNGVGIAQFACKLYRNGNSRKLFYGVFSGAACVICRTAGGYYNMVYRAKLFIGKVKLRKVGYAVFHSRFNGGFKGVGLFHNLFEHKMLIAALFCGFGIPHNAGYGLFHTLAGGVINADFVRGKLGKLAVLKIYYIPCMRNKSGHIGSKKVFADSYA